MADPTDAGKRSDWPAIAGAAGLGAVLVAGALAVVMLRDAPSDDAAISPPIAVLDPSGAPEPVVASPDIEPAAGAPLPPALPRFDLVRVDPTGNALIAGQAEPLAEITLALDGAPLEVVTADAGGQFVAMLAVAPSEVPRILSLRALLSDGRALMGEETAIIAPFRGAAPVADALAAAAPSGRSPETRPDRPARDDTAAAVAPADLSPDAEDGDATRRADRTADPVPIPEPRPSGDTDLADVTGDEAGAEAGQMPQVLAAPPDVPQAPTIVLADRDGIRVLQDPEARPEGLSDLQLDAISYDTAGAVTLAGRGPASASVRVMLDDLPVTRGEIGPGGRWSLDLPDVEPGTYRLRVEQLASDGTVTGEIETPFLREDPARIRDDAMLVADGVSVITVQRGFTLWGIAEANFGDGILYLQIFEENSDEIRDPDLIFPGQIFALPDLPRGGRAE